MGNMPWLEEPWVALYLMLSTIENDDTSGDIAQLERLPNMLDSILALHKLNIVAHIYNPK